MKIGAEFNSTIRCEAFLCPTEKPHNQVLFVLSYLSRGGFLMNNKRTHILVRLALLAVLVVAMLLVPAQRALAAACVSTGPGNWSNPAIWSCGVVPGAGDTVSIGHAVILDAVSARTVISLAITPGGSLLMNNNLTLTGTSGNVLDLNGTGGINLNGRTLLMNGSTAGGSSNIRVCDADHSISSTLAGGLFRMTTSGTNSFTRYVTTAGCSTPGSVTFGSNVTIQVDAGYWQYGDFDPGSGLTTINGTLKINPGGEIVGNSPTYGSGSTLNYNTGGGANYTAGPEWAAGTDLSTPGVPYNVLLSNGNTNVVFPIDATRTVMGDLTIGSLTNINLSSSCGVGTCSLTVKGDWSNNGGQLTHNGRAVIFDSTLAHQFIGGTAVTTFFDLVINNSNDVELAYRIEIENMLDMQLGNFDLDFYNVTIGPYGWINNPAPSTTRMIIADDGRLCKIFTGTSSYDFRYVIGDHQDPDDNTNMGPAYLNYTPFRLILPFGVYNAYNVCAKVTHPRHPFIGATITTDYLWRYWTLTSSGTGVGTFDGQFLYDGRDYQTGVGDVGDVIGDEGNMFGAEFYPSGLLWTWFDPVVPAPWSYFYIAGVTMKQQADYTALPKTPTAAAMASMEAVPAAGQVLVRWTTALELDTSGFKVYRSTSLEGERTLLDSDLIPSQAAGQVGGASYEFIDATAQAGVEYYYWIEALESGGSTFFGPMQATWYYQSFLPMLIR
jgi:hypothetical protein